MSKTYVKLNLGKFKQATERARLELAKIIIKDTTQFVPHEKGRLEKAFIRLAPNGSSWAKRGEKKHVVNKDLKFNQSVNPYAGKYWFLRAKNKYFDKWINDFKYLL